ncbi:FitA-like ribbon-helix-helix domain-containing protein [Brevibacterium album]|uniref:FitA-like ribbon-helix-helix domain-containing protein n=1 Tax=Brevibacterium album TaxID=417948 RepID=UPI00041CCD48|nr:hypothetical protein [Brevibacterium album]
MASIVVRGIDDEVKQAFRQLAAARGSSMEAELRRLMEREVRERAAEVGGARSDLHPAGVPVTVNAAEAPGAAGASGEPPQEKPWLLQLRELALEYGRVELDIPPRVGDITEVHPGAAALRSARGCAGSSTGSAVFPSMGTRRRHAP